MKKKASPDNIKVLVASAKEAGRKAVLKSLNAGLTVYGLENGVIVGLDFNSHPLTMKKSKLDKKKPHQMSIT